MREQEAFAELLRRHEELTQRFAQLLHDDAGQVLTSIALQLSALDGVAPDELETLNSTLDDLLERFREAQASLGGAVVAKRGLLAGLSQLARMKKSFRVEGDVAPRSARTFQGGGECGRSQARRGRGNLRIREGACHSWRSFAPKRCTSDYNQDLLCKFGFSSLTTTRSCGTGSKRS
ncbi:MAG: histidine kinase dimerization/phosphoacceptor domain-containing protein [Acidobacteria bacterium]|nr:histidine kinase dimerization/phosphoacceptor domain-containing protein [Acidobacteriota bacterium]